MSKIIQDYENGIRLLQAYNKGLLEKIGQIERERDEARQERDGLSIMLTAAESAFETIKRERDAAVEQLKEVDVSSYFECAHCKHEELCDSPVWPCNDCDNEECPCHTCSEGSNWQWRGVPQEVQHGTD